MEAGNNARTQPDLRIEKTDTSGRRMRLTAAQTLRGILVLLLALFVASTVLSLRSIRSIDESFNRVASIDQPLQRVATDLTTSADQASVSFLESLVLNKDVSSAEAVEAFDRGIARYWELVDGFAEEDEGRHARELFGRLKGLGRELIEHDQLQQQWFLSLQESFEQMDDSLEGTAHPGNHLIEDTLGEAARWVANYVASPSRAYEGELLEKFDAVAGELRRQFSMAARGPGRSKLLRGLLSDVDFARRQAIAIVEQTNNMEQKVGVFLSTRAALDRQLNHRISDRLAMDLATRTVAVQGVVSAAKVVLVVCLLVGLVVGLGTYLWVRRRITRPVEKLMAAIGALGAGRVPDDELARNDEFGLLAQSLSEAGGRRALLEEQLSHQVFHDPLTGLANRALFMERLDHARARTRRRMTPLSVLFVDLDGFKAINDTLGHQAGDELLITVSRRLESCLRDEDTVARLGGDEFGIVLEETSSKGATEAAARLATTLQASTLLGTGDVAITASIGIATGESDEEPDTLLSQADTAMYAAKARGKGLWQVFEPGMHAEAERLESLRSDLQLAVERDEFIAVYQPIVDLTTRRVVAVEALARWNHPERGVLPPFEFIATAEETGHILYIDRWVMREACRQVKQWQQTLPEAADLRVTVNISARQLQHPGLVDEVTDALASSGLAADHLVVEITESALISDLEAAVTELRKLSALGISLALDDFGTGYSSLNRLHRLPFDTLKIDRSFISALGCDEEQTKLALAIVQLGQTLHMTTVAEGIEEEGQLDLLRAAGCELGQGYLFARPLTESDLAALLQRNSVSSPEEAEAR